MQEKKTLKNNLIDPMKDKKRLMKMEHFLSSNYVLAAIVIVLDLCLFFLWNYGTHLLLSIPRMLFHPEEKEKLLSLRYLLPETFSILGMGVILLVMLVIDILLIVKIKVSWSEDYFNVGQKGTARWTTEEEIKQEYKEIEPLHTPYPGMPGILVCRIGNRFYIDDTWVNNLILGLTRSGKGESLVKTSIEIYSRAEIQPSLLLNDMKLELYKVFAPILEARGYEVHLLNASNPKMSMGFNLVTVALEYYKKKDYDMSEMVVNSLAHSFFCSEKATGEMQYFTNASAALFSAMVLASIMDAVQADQFANQKRYEEWIKNPEEERKKHPFIYRQDNEKTINLYSMVVNFGELVLQPITKDGRRTMLDKYFEGRPRHDRARLQYLSVEVAPGKTKSGVFSEMLRQLKQFTLYNVARMTAESTVDLKKIGFGEKPVAVFMAVPSYDSSLYCLPTIFIRQMYYVLGKACDDGKGKCDRPVKVIFDEAGNMPEVEFMQQMMTMGLGQNISFDLYVQSYEQLEYIYGKELAETIKGNCGNHYYLQTMSEDTAKEFSNKLHNESYIDIQRAGSKLSLNKYLTESVQERPLLNANQLMELQEGENVIFRSSKRRDNQGNKIKPRSIFNSVENGHYFWYAYEFFTEEFKNPNEVDFLDICKESRSHIEPKERIWDVEKSFEMMTQKNRELKTLAEAGYQTLNKLFVKSLGANYEEKYGINAATTVAEAASLIMGQPIPEAERDAIMSILLRAGVQNRNVRRANY